ncbi:thiamine phosphate synthase [Ornithinibacillus scapharcae]|uniref:thiamine phosphate synthase n=1 Tax=Ornithinibacillus scapharcae TaxID=1147159 RepID=UPI000225BBBE|nr:thiamine phosphate synthase [Ornithinibacillus scapharcae]
MKRDYTLYLVTEGTLPIERLLAVVEEAIKGGVTMVQLRDKESSGEEFFGKAVKLRELTRRYEIPLIINDRVDVALATDADGVHIGQSDLPLSEVRRLVPPSMIVGVSTSTVEQALAAEHGGADYIGVGAVFPTQSKKNAKVLAPGKLESIIEKVSLPVIAIGGITNENIDAVLTLDVTGVAVVSVINKAEDPYMVAKSLRSALER